MPFVSIPVPILHTPELRLHSEPLHHNPEQIYTVRKPVRLQVALLYP